MRIVKSFIQFKNVKIGINKKACNLFEKRVQPFCEKVTCFFDCPLSIQKTCRTTYWNGLLERFFDVPLRPILINKIILERINREAMSSPFIFDIR